MQSLLRVRRPPWQVRLHSPHSLHSMAAWGEGPVQRIHTILGSARQVSTYRQGTAASCRAQTPGSSPHMCCRGDRTSVWSSSPLHMTDCTQTTRSRDPRSQLIGRRKMVIQFEPACCHNQRKVSVPDPHTIASFPGAPPPPPPPPPPP